MWLGIDVGTGGSRALLINRQGEVIAACTAAHEDMHMAQPLWAEQRPENWWDAVGHSDPRRPRPGGRRRSAVRGIGLSGSNARPRDARCGSTASSAPRSSGAISAARRRSIGSTTRSAVRACSNASPTPSSPASRCPSCCGCATTSRSSSNACARFSCPRITCASDSPASSPPRFRTPPAPPSSTS